jgi:hypothetical protein
MIDRFAQRECCASNPLSIGRRNFSRGLDDHCVDACHGGLRSRLWDGPTHAPNGRQSSFPCSGRRQPSRRHRLSPPSSLNGPTSDRHFSNRRFLRSPRSRQVVFPPPLLFMVGYPTARVRTSNEARGSNTAAVPPQWAVLATSRRSVTLGETKGHRTRATRHRSRWHSERSGTARQRGAG